jgi:hypothetical protein
VRYGKEAVNNLVTIEDVESPASGNDTCGQIEVPPVKRPGFAFVP